MLNFVLGMFKVDNCRFEDLITLDNSVKHLSSNFI